MAVPTATDITSMGFSHEMFGLPLAADLTTVIDGLIAEHGVEVSGVLGATIFGSTAEPASTRVKRAIKFYVAADLCQNRINRLAQEVKQDNGMDSLKMRRQMADYIAKAQQEIQLIQNDQSAGSDFAIGCVVSSHFDTV